MKRILPLIALALAACVTVSPGQASPTAGFGQVAIVDGIRVRPLSVIEDSRCPASVQCVWAGQVRLLVEIDAPGGGEQQRRELTMGQPVSLYGGRLTLSGVQPPKGIPGAIEDQRYRFTFRFER